MSEYREKLDRAQKEFEEADEALTAANVRYEAALKALRDAIDDK